MREFTDKEISYWLGFSATEMWDEFMPNLDDDTKAKCSKIIGDEMDSLVMAGKAKLYDGSEQALKTLKSSGYNLIFLSNCTNDYLKYHKKQFHLEKYFTGFYPAEKYGYIPKYEIFEYINADFSGDFIAIGDRFIDMELAEKHNLKAIGCGYGYGTAKELAYANVIIEDVSELSSAVENLDS